MRWLLALLLFTGCGASPNAMVIQGRDGKDGDSCTVAPVSNGAIITCGASTSLILNGEDAPPTAYTVVDIINPCGDATGHDEVLFRLQNRSLIAHYASGSAQFLTVLAPGSFVTTDGTNCHFSVNNAMDVVW